MMMIMMMKLVVAETADDVGPLGTCQALMVVSRYHHQPYIDTDTVVIHTLIVCVKAMMMMMMMKLEHVVAETAGDVGPLGTCQALMVVSRYHHQPYTDTDTPL